MPGLVPCLSCLVVLFPPVGVRTDFVQVAPFIRAGDELRRAPGQDRAVVLLQGLAPHPISRDAVYRPDLRDWQKPGSRLVERLAHDSDVYAFAYGQCASVDVVADQDDLARWVRKLREAGYREVVLVGFSAGGLIARQLVEDRPAHGVTRVLQVCTPNGGSNWTKLAAVRADQREFVGSLGKGPRQRVQQSRAGKRIPDDVAFACVVGTGTVVGDGFVRTDSQWSRDLQAQGVPAYPVFCTHPEAARGKVGVETIAGLVTGPLPRWNPEQVEAVRRRLPGASGGWLR